MFLLASSKWEDVFISTREGLYHSSHMVKLLWGFAVPKNNQTIEVSHPLLRYMSEREEVCLIRFTNSTSSHMVESIWINLTVG